MKIGIYGGSFNPCHLMHKEIVLKLLENNYFDRIVILPTGNFYKKSNLLKGEERKKMLELMFEDNKQVIICDYEFKNNLICTYRSLDYLQNLYKGDKLYFILGSDNMLHFDTWKRYEYILDTYNLLIIKRKNIDISSILEKYQHYKGSIKLVDLDLADIKSTEIRDNIFNNRLDLAKEALDSKVFSYILDKKLYSQDYKEYPDITYTSDEEFIKNYRSDDYEKMSITTDITLFSVSDIKKENYRRKNKKCFSILLVKRNRAPFMNKWCLPGGFLSLDEKLLDCAKRVLFTEANIDNVYLDQMHTFSDIERDIRGRVLSVSYLGLIDQSLISANLKSNASFFDVTVNESDSEITLTFKNSELEFSCKLEKTTDDYGIVSYKELENNYLAFDNLQVISTSIDYLKNNINNNNLVFHMMPKLFTLKELELVYEAILNQKLIDSAFRRTIASKVEKTEFIINDGGHRPSALYRYKGKKQL